MTYDIVFVQKGLSPVAEDGPKVKAVREKAVGESVFLANLPTSPKVFALFYPGDVDTVETEKRLRALGQKTGDNLFVNFSTLADPDYELARERFGIRPLPAIVVTAVSALAATPDGDTPFVRLDGKSLFAKPNELVHTVEELFNLFLGGRIRQAIVVGWAHQGKAAVASAVERVWAVIQPVIAWAAHKDIKLEFATAKIEVKESGRG
jgi:hypothetical protein